MQYVLYSVKDRIGYITLNRPEKKNAMSSGLVAELSKVFTEAESDPAVKVIVLQSAGDTFCAGADLGYLQQLQQNSYEENVADSNQLKSLFYQVSTLKKVVIASIQGHALAGGCGLASVCDFAFAVPHAKFGYTEVKIGFIPAIVMVFLLRKIGESKAKHLLLSGDQILAAEALNAGLVYKIVEPETLQSEVDNFAAHLVKTNSSNSMMVTKLMASKLQSMSLEEGLDYAVQMNATVRGSDDCKKGIGAFLNKEKITW